MGGKRRIAAAYLDFLSRVHLVQTSKEATRIRQVLVDFLGRSSEQIFELTASPLYCVLDFIWKMLQSARRSFLLWRIICRTVGLGDMRVDNLGVSLRALKETVKYVIGYYHCSRLKQRQLVVNTTTIHVSSGINIVQSVCNTAQAFKKVITEDRLGVFSHAISERGYFQIWIELANGSGSNIGLLFADISTTKQELKHNGR